MVPQIKQGNGVIVVKLDQFPVAVTQASGRKAAPGIRTTIGKIDGQSNFLEVKGIVPKDALFGDSVSVE